MTVRYIRVNPVVDLFAPAVRAFGNIAVVGQVLPVTAPAAPTAAAATGTGLGIGKYRYAVTMVTDQGESEVGAEATVDTTAGNQVVKLTAIPTGGAGTNTVARRLYRTVVNGAAGSGRLLATIEDNSTTVFTDTTADARLGDEPPIARANTPIAFTDPVEARRRAPGDLGEAIALAFAQSPGPTLVHGVRTAAGPDWASALNAVAPLDAQLIVLANTALDATTGAATGGAIVQLANHVSSVSNTGGDGKERMGVAMLAKGATATGVVTGALANERMVYIAHKSDQDAAAAVAGVIAGYEPHISMLLKPVNITSKEFTPSEIAAINGTETFASGPAGNGVNWLVNPELIPGQGTYLGEGYTGNPGGKKYIDIVRTIDDVSFRLKAQLIKTIGNLRMSRSGLRALEAQMEAVLQPLMQSEVIEDFEITTPLKVLLDKDPNTLTEAELRLINDAQAQRVIEVLVSVDYAGAIHRLSLTLKFV
ncbi:hypothetical protein BN159_0111 [Streptomyces davaonensis JCM 4913]|uniref:Uncharacterized protein n=1 Tax=Streptomyces davaonensis (strain DSM 101723 / JCM 4913 / KCC S-0913 / 768) TaxID=1214101 RepID=K4QUP5_STRDJ|nr:hypothetical protein [Streptomyces davaonensis]CCK24490.1 hypothetical protein BN159_0111 [Streptomyces davaonensis JCM 4913]